MSDIAELEAVIRRLEERLLTPEVRARSRKNLPACSQTTSWSSVVRGACLIGKKSLPRSRSNPKSSLRSRSSR